MGFEVELTTTETGIAGRISPSSHISHGSNKSNLKLDKPMPLPPMREEETGPVTVAGVEVKMPPPVPKHILESCIAEPERLPVWVRTAPGIGPVVDLSGEKRGGLGCHPVSEEEKEWLQSLKRPDPSIDKDESK
jgi:hypothetical protein